MSYVVCWLDSHDAKVFSFDAEQVRKAELHIKKEDHGEDHFYHRVAEALHNAFEVLLVGPGVAKTQFVRHLENHKSHGNLKARIKGIENMDHPTDGQIIDYGKRFFKRLEVFKAI